MVLRRSVVLLFAAACEPVDAPSLDAVADARPDAALADVAEDAAPPRHPPPRCTRDDEAPLPDGRGGVRCVAVGASTTQTAADLPDPRAVDPSLPEPVRWVRGGATGGDGTRERPFATLAQALASLPAAGGTLALALGRHAVSAPVAVRGSLALVGVGATHTVLLVGDGASALTVRGGARLTLHALSVEHPTGDVRPGAVGDIDASSSASVTLREVVFLRPQSAVVASDEGTRVVADGLTVRLARGPAITARDGARATLRDALVRDGGDVGVAVTASGAGASGAALQLTDALVAGNAAGGVALAGRLDTGMGADCDAADLAASAGNFDCLLRVAVVANGAAGIAVADRRIAQVRGSYVGATRATMASAGDGVTVRRGAAVHLDDDLGRLDPMTILGRGTQVLVNERVGVLVDGAGSALRAHGALIASNRGPGLVFQRGGLSPAFNGCVVSDNVGAGLAVLSGGAVAGILCDQFVYTRAGAVRGAAGTVIAGDGLSVYGGRVDAIRDNDLSNNARFGLVLSGATPYTLPAIEILRNRGAGNGFGAAVYGMPPLLFDGPERIMGRAPAPMVDPGGASEAF